MAAPTLTTRGTPGATSGFNRFLEDGHATKISFDGSNASAEPFNEIEFWEKTVEGPGIEGGDPIETTTMHNTEWRTFAPRQLKTLTAFTIQAAYDPYLYTNILELINNSRSVTVTFPDGSTLRFFGFLQNFEPEALEEGTFPMASLTIVPTNYDRDTDCTEEPPVVVGVAGT